MKSHVKSAIFIYSVEGEQYLDAILQNPYGTVIHPATIEEFRKNPAELLKGGGHLVVALGLDLLKEVMTHAMEHGNSLGFLPLPAQKALSRCYSIPNSEAEMVAVALGDNPVDLDLVLCNDEILLFKGTIGRLPLIDSLKDDGKWGVISNGFKKMASLKLLPFTIETFGNNKAKLDTAATGCLVLQNPEKSFASNIIQHDSSFQDGMISLLIVAPFSIIDYFKLMWLRVISAPQSIRVPPSLGYIKTPEVTIESQKNLSVIIDGEKKTETPARLRVVPAALKINCGNNEELRQSASGNSGEKYIVQHLPAGKELQKARNSRVPFFTYASEERFRDLFTALRDDAKLDSTYVVLMVLSTVLATVGLYLNSASVIIGAMLLAPLMAPIISMAMSLLRYDRKLFKQSLLKICVGVGLALGTSLILTAISPYQPLTAEMQGRLNPTVLDLVVAIAAGIAGAYTKSYKEFLGSLAGVAIAVALVPPLAVAGIGLGRLAPSFFGHAFLLFLTNLIGIVLAATFTFRVLGFSPVVRDKKSLTMFAAFFIMISIPLSMAFHGITERATFEKNWQYERFLVNDKYLIVQSATLQKLKKRQVLIVDIQAREQLSRYDLSEFRRKVKRNFDDDIIIRAKITYIP